MRDYLVLALVLLTLPLAFYRPFFGLLGFSWLAYMRPQNLAWGMAAELPLSKWVAAALWLSLIMRGKLNPFRRTPITSMLLVLWGWLLVSCFTAQRTEIAFNKFEDISKVILVSLLTVVLVTDVKRFRLSMAVIGFSLGFLGLKYGVYGMLAGGVRFTRGVGGMIGDNNDFALALNMAIPVLVYLVWDLESKWWRFAAMGMAPVMALTVIFTHSRGGFLSLCAIVLFLISQSRRKLATMLVIAVLGLAGSVFVPQSFYERVASIGDYKEDGSAMGRLNAWQASLDMANDYPITGVGLDNFLAEFQYYAPDPDDIHVAHNTWFQVLAEAGYTGLLVYVSLFVVTWWTLFRIRSRARRWGLRWAENGAKCLAASIVAFMVGATFLNRAHFDLIYHVMALCAALDRVTAHEIRLLRSQPADEDNGTGEPDAEAA